MWLMWLYLIGQSDESLRALRGKEAPCGTPKHPRQFTEDFRRQIVALVDSGKPRAEVMREYDLGKSTLDRWIKRVHACGSTAAADNRAPEQNRLIELERENARLKMGVDVLKRAALVFARK